MDTLISRSATLQVVPHRGWSSARDTLLTAVRDGAGLSALLGPPGTGKSLLLQELARTLLAEGAPVALLQTGDAAIDPATDGVLLIDEADRMSDDALAALAGRCSSRAVVLAALPGFADRLAGLPGAAQIVALNPLDLTEAAALVEARLLQAGQPPDLLEPAATEELFARSGGVPRVLHTLLSLAIFAASLEDTAHVTPAHVRQAVSFRDGEEPGERPEVVVAVTPVAPMQLTAPKVEVASETVAATGTRSRRWVGWVVASLLLLLGGGLALLAYQAPLPTGTAPSAERTTAAAASSAAARRVPDLPAAAIALPANSLVRVVLSYPMGDAKAARLGVQIAQSLRIDGITTGDPVPVTPGVAAPAVLYFFAQDREGATAIAERLAGQFGVPTLVRLPPRSALPRPGTVELRLAASGP